MNSDPKIAVVGLGYVGLPLAVALAKHFDVTGFDVDEGRVQELESGHDRTGEIEPNTLSASRLRLTAGAEDITGSDFYIVTVPTPVDGANQPDLSAVKGASATVGKALKKGAIVVYESTVYPGVTEDVAGPVLEAASGLKCSVDFFLGYSPERINPGDREHTIERITKVIAGQTPEVTAQLKHIYGAITGGNIYAARDIRTAEAAKVIENAQRDINIAFVNEVAQIFQKMGLSVHDVLDAAGTKWNFLPFTPGLVGGHCIGVDPFYLAHAANALGYQPDVILSGRRINDAMGDFVAEQIAEGVTQGGGRAGGRALVLGLTFKENVPDLRNTRVIDVVDGLRARGFEVDIHDSFADAAEAKRLFDIDLITEIPRDERYDCLVGAVPHNDYVGLADKDFSEILRPGGMIADIKGIWRNTGISNGFSRWQL